MAVLLWWSNDMPEAALTSCQAIVLVKNPEGFTTNSNFQLVLASICPASACIAFCKSKRRSYLDINYNIEKLIVSLVL